MTKWAIEVLCGPEMPKTWKELRPTHNGKDLPPYRWGTSKEAKDALRLCYPDNWDGNVRIKRIESE